MPPLLRKPRRLTITVSEHVYQKLLADSDLQGRSLSNYAAYMLESSLERLASSGAHIRHLA
ncbi:MAG: CopG-like 1 or ribbon-helix-helix domain, 5 [Cyanobacteriota bacterium]|jgi:predicted CopG family antitoxin